MDLHETNVVTLMQLAAFKDADEALDNHVRFNAFQQGSVQYPGSYRR